MSLRVVIIGAVAAGPKAGCRIRRLMPEANITMLDKDSLISYGGCGIPFFVSGDVADVNELMSTSAHQVRNPQFFKDVKGVDAIASTEVVSIDRKAKTVTARPSGGGPEKTYPYDKLMIATGAAPFVPPVKGADLNGVYPVADLHHAQAIKDLVAKGQVGKVAIVGAGATGLEMAEALNDLWGLEVDIIEAADQILPGILDPEFAHMFESHIRKQEDVGLHLGTPLEEVLDDGQGNARGVRAGGKEFEADLVIMACGVRPNSQLAKDAGLEVSDRGAIMVNRRMQTSDADIYAAGDCVSLPCLITGNPMYVAAGSLANRAARVAASNIAGLEAEFQGTLGSWCMKIFGLAVGRTGLNEARAKELGLEVTAPLVAGFDRAHFHQDSSMMYVKLVVERESQRLVGISVLGESGDAVVGRVNTLAGLMRMGGKIEDLANLELAYSPPLGAAVDILNSAAYTAENLIQGRLKTIHPSDYAEKLAKANGDMLFLDIRAARQAGPFLEAHPKHWVNIPQEELRQRLEELPKDKELLVICNTGARSYECVRVLDAAGIKNTYNLSGGIAAARQWGDSGIEESGSSEE